LEVLTKIRYFNIGFYIFSNIKILLDINQNDKKYAGNLINSEQIFSACPGEEEGLWCRSKRHRLLIPLFFLKQCMKRRRFTQNAPFHLKGNGAKACQI
jgi:hypothetical protein